MTHNEAGAPAAGEVVRPTAIDAGGPPRGVVALMFDSRFGTLFWGRLVSSMGIWMHGLVAAVVTFELTGSATAVGLVAAVAAVPQLLLGPLFGRTADAGFAVHQILVGRAFCGLGCAALAVGLWGMDEGRTFGYMGILCASAVVGLGFAVEAPATQTVIPQLVPARELPAAMTLNLLPLTLARAVGPILGGVVATALSPSAAFALAAGTQVTLVAVVAVMRVPKVSFRNAESDLSVREALRYVRREPAVLRLLVGIAAVSIGAEPGLTLAPPLADHLGGGASLASWLASSFGFGAAIGLLGSIVLLRWIRLDVQVSTGLGVLACASGAVALAGEPTLALWAVVVAGFGMTFAMSSLTTDLQSRTPDVLRGRIMALWLVGFLGIRPPAATLGGVIAEHVSLPAAYLCTAAVVAIGAFVCRPSKLRVRPVAGVTAPATP